MENKKLELVIFPEVFAKVNSLSFLHVSKVTNNRKGKGGHNE